jgi:hypothetical protein
MKKIALYVLSTLLVLSLVPVTRTGAAPRATFDLDTGNAPVEIIVPSLVGEIFSKVSPGGGDAPQILRVTTLITNGWFDAITPYHPTAVGVSADLGRRPAAERTERNRNVATLYASLRVLSATIPQATATWREMLATAGLDPDDDRHDLTTAVGIGNTAGDAVLADRAPDGMNQLGDERGCQVPCQPLADYTGYRPRNTPYTLTDPSHWQPLITGNGTGTFTSQVAAVPQWGRTRPYSYTDPDQFRVSHPRASDIRNRAAYRRQADQVIEQSATMTEEQKLTAELFNNKLRSLGFSTLFASQSNGFGVEKFVILDFLDNVASFDTGIAVWHEKYRYDAVRPVSAVRYLNARRTITAWAGPGKGVARIPGDQWQSYLPTANHSEYPSGSAAFCTATAAANRRYLGTDTLGWQVPFPAGSSVIEPGATPTKDRTLTFPTWTDFAQRCGDSRFWSGVHFKPAVTAGNDIGEKVGAKAFTYVMSHVNGTP